LYEYVDTYPLEDIDPQNPRVRITDLSDDLAYYFVVTAYDANGNESDYSDEVCVIDGGACPESWLAYRRQSLNSAGVSDSSGGGGGGGGACFIATSNLSGNTQKALSSKHIFLFLTFLIVIGASLVIQANKSILMEWILSQFKSFLHQRPDSGYFFEIFIAVQEDCPVLHCDLGDAAIYRAVDGSAFSS
jgi:hypothetical protein